MKFNIGDRVTINKKYCEEIYGGFKWSDTLLSFAKESGVCTITKKSDGQYKLKEDTSCVWWDDEELTKFNDMLPEELFEL